jgi:hypothetical protein
MSMKARRSGLTARQWSNDPWGEKLTHRIDQRTQKPVISCRCLVPSKGGGRTEVEFDMRMATTGSRCAPSPEASGS